MKRLLAFGVAAILVLVSAPAGAVVPQTINVDGVNDFDPSNLLSDDTGDTQTGCSPAALPMDLGRVYVTNDANFLYIGIEFAKTCYCDMNLGMAIDVNSAGGGTTDPFGRKIGWASVPFKPDWVIYDVTPTTCNTFNYEILYKDSLGTWYNRSTLINPSWGSGSNGLGIIDSTSFRELKIPLSVLGATTGTPLHLEFWVTQEGLTKGPLDAMCSDNVQMSRVGQTTYDTTAVVQMTCMAAYTIQNAIDTAPPTLSGAQAINFAVLANKQFNLLSSKVDVAFSEPVDLATAQTSGNYTFSGPASRTVVGAVRDGAALNVVHLTLNSPINANAAAYSIRAINVKDPANNVIVNNGTTNLRSFFIQNVTFNGDFHIGLCNAAFAVTDTFAVEGNLIPLSFALCDNGVMTDANSDSIYSLVVPFCLPVNPGTGKGEADLEWKFSRICSQYEPLGSNRTYHLTSDNGATPVISASWNNDSPSNFTARAMDVVFKVDASRRNPVPSDVITLVGSALPLTFSQPGVAMLDNGVAPDAVSGDKIYTARVRFPACAPKNLGWKVDFNGVYECAGQGDRSLFLNDVLYSTTTPLVLPARGIDRCEVTDKAITVVFKVNMERLNPAPTSPPDTIAVMGDRSPLRFDYPDPVDIMLNDGLGYDQSAADEIFTRAITFPDSTPFVVSFKYWKDGVFECASIGNRTFTLNDAVYSTGNPFLRFLNTWDYCSDPTAVPAEHAHGGRLFASLRPVMPNPVSRRANLAFELFRDGRVSLNIYDVSGRRVAKLLDASLAAGLHVVSWDGLDDSGVRLSSGVYLCELAMGGERQARRMILTH